MKIKPFAIRIKREGSINPSLTIGASFRRWQIRFRWWKEDNGKFWIEVLHFWTGGSFAPLMVVFNGHFFDLDFSWKRDWLEIGDGE